MRLSQLVYRPLFLIIIIQLALSPLFSLPTAHAQIPGGGGSDINIPGGSLNSDPVKDTPKQEPNTENCQVIKDPQTEVDIKEYKQLVEEAGNEVSEPDNVDIVTTNWIRNFLKPQPAHAAIPGTAASTIGNTGNLFISIQVNSLNEYRETDRTFGILRPPTNFIQKRGPTFVEIDGPKPFPYGSPNFGQKVDVTKSQVRRVPIGADGIARFYSLPKGSYDVIRTEYPGFDGGHSFKTDLSRGYVFDIPRLDVPNRSPNFRLAGAYGAIVKSQKPSGEFPTREGALKERIKEIVERNPEAAPKPKGRLVVSIRINSIKKNGNSYGSDQDFGSLKSPGATIEVYGPLAYRSNSDSASKTITTKAKIHKAKIGSDGIARFENMPDGRYRFVRTTYKGLGGGHHFERELDYGVVANPEKPSVRIRRWHVPEVEINEEGKTSYSLEGLDGAIMQRDHGHLKIVVKIEKPDGSKVAGPKGVAVRLLLENNGQRNNGPLIRGSAPSETKLAYTGADGIARFYDLKAYTSNTNPWTTTIESLSHERYVGKELATPDKFTLAPNQMNSRTALLVSKSEIKKSQEEQKKAEKKQDEKFNPKDYGYISEDRDRVTRAIKQSDLSCKVKNDTLQTLEKIQWFSIYQFEPKRAELLKAIKDDNVLSVIVSAERRGTKTQTRVNAGGTLPSVTTEQVSVAGTKPNLQIFKTGNRFTQDDPELHWPGIEKIEAKIHREIKTARRSNLPANEAAKKLAKFVPTAQEDGHGLLFAWKYESPGAQLQVPLAIANKRIVRFIGKWRGEGKAWMRKSFPVDYNWFYSYWFEPNSGTDYKSDSWNKSEEEQLKQFFDNYITDWGYQNNDISPVLEDPIFNIVLLATGLKAGQGLLLGTDDLIWGTIAIGANKTLPKALQWLGKESFVGNLGRWWSKRIFDAEKARLIKSLGKSLQGKSQTEIEELAKKESDQFVDSLLDKESKAEIEAEIVRRFGREEATKIMADFNEKLRQQVLVVARRYTDENPPGVIKKFIPALKSLIRKQATVGQTTSTHPVTRGGTKVAKNIARSRPIQNAVNSAEDAVNRVTRPSEAAPFGAAVEETQEAVLDEYHKAIRDVFNHKYAWEIFLQRAGIQTKYGLSGDQIALLKHRGYAYRNPSLRIHSQEEFKRVFGDNVDETLHKIYQEYDGALHQAVEFKQENLRAIFERSIAKVAKEKSLTQEQIAHFRKVAGYPPDPEEVLDFAPNDQIPVPEILQQNTTSFPIDETVPFPTFNEPLPDNTSSITIPGIIDETFEQMTARVEREAAQQTTKTESAIFPTTVKQFDDYVTKQGIQDNQNALETSINDFAVANPEDKKGIAELRAKYLKPTTPKRPFDTAIKFGDNAVLSAAKKIEIQKRIDTAILQAQQRFGFSKEKAEAILNTITIQPANQCPRRGTCNPVTGEIKLSETLVEYPLEFENVLRHELTHRLTSPKNLTDFSQDNVSQVTPDGIRYTPVLEAYTQLTAEDELIKPAGFQVLPMYSEEKDPIALVRTTLSALYTRDGTASALARMKANNLISNALTQGSIFDIDKEIARLTGSSVFSHTTLAKFMLNGRFDIAKAYVLTINGGKFNEAKRLTALVDQPPSTWKHVRPPSLSMSFWKTSPKTADEIQSIIAEKKELNPNVSGAFIIEEIWESYGITRLTTEGMNARVLNGSKFRVEEISNGQLAIIWRDRLTIEDYARDNLDDPQKIADDFNRALAPLVDR